MTVAVLLAVDDRPDNLFVLEQVVKAYLPEIEMITAESAEAGLALAAAAAIDGALIDVQMPGLNGIEMCRRLKADPRTAPIHVILVTAHGATSALKAQGMEAGADDFITKPIDNAELAAKLRVMLRLRAAEDALRRERDHLEEAVQERTQALRDAENRYRTLFQTAGDAIFINDLDGGLLEVNDEACRLLGYTREDLLDLTVGDLTTPEYAARRTKLLKQLQAAGHLVFETELVTRDGRIIPAECSSRLLDLQGRPTVLSLVRDITDRKQAEEALLSAAQKWRATFDAIGDAIFLLDPDGKIVQCNRAMADLVGKTFSEIVGRPCWEVVHGTAGPIDGCPMECLRQTNKQEEVVLPMGESWFKVTVYPILDEAGNLTGAVHILADITQLKRTEAKLFASLGESIQRQTEVRALLEASQIVVTEPSFEVAIRDILILSKSLIGFQAGYAALAPEAGKGEQVLLGAIGGVPGAAEPALARLIAGFQDEADAQGKPIFHNDLAHGEEVQLWPGGQERLDNILVAPLQAEGRTWGHLGLANKPGGFGEDDANLAAGFAELATISLINQQKEAALRHSEEQHRLLVNQVPAVVFKGYADWSMDFVDGKVEDLTGYSQEDFATRRLTWKDLILPEDLAHGRRKFMAARQSEKSFEWEYRIRRKDGEVRWIQDMVQIFENSAGKIDHVSGILFDITDHKAAEERFFRSTRALKALSACNQALARATDEKNFISGVCKVIVQEGGYPLAWVGFSQPDAVKSVVPVAYFGGEDEDPDWMKITWGSDEHSKSPGGVAIKTGQTQVARDILHNPAFAPWHEEWRRQGFNAVIALPLLVDGKTIGILDIFALDSKAFDSEEVRLLEELAGGLAFGIGALRTDLGRRQAESEVQASLEKMRQALEKTVSAVATIVEMRDPYTAGHQKRVAQLACAIAQEMGYSPEGIEGMRVLGCLHDIGKMSVPAEILSKPGRLSETEFSIIKDHARLGYEIIKDIDFPYPVAQGILQHHERLNGSGYPQGISGADITPEAKILSVADVVEAMASYRPYRTALGIEKALEEIARNRGILYDPEVVDICLEIFSEKEFSFGEGSSGGGVAPAGDDLFPLRKDPPALRSAGQIRHLSGAPEGWPPAIGDSYHAVGRRVLRLRGAGHSAHRHGQGRGRRFAGHCPGRGHHHSPGRSQFRGLRHAQGGHRAGRGQIYHVPDGSGRCPEKWHRHLGEGAVRLREHKPGSRSRRT
jgi:PAS domain S-box-containing protein/putative nucleotidyltransferase with HDIG domain